jgi:hypothetical protein
VRELGPGVASTIFGRLRLPTEGELSRPDLARIEREVARVKVSMKGGAAVGLSEAVGFTEAGAFLQGVSLLDRLDPERQGASYKAALKALIEGFVGRDDSSVFVEDAGPATINIDDRERNVLRSVVTGVDKRSRIEKGKGGLVTIDNMTADQLKALRDGALNGAVMTMQGPSGVAQAIARIYRYPAFTVHDPVGPVAPADHESLLEDLGVLAPRPYDGSIERHPTLETMRQIVDTA